MFCQTLTIWILLVLDVLATQEVTSLLISHFCKDLLWGRSCWTQESYDELEICQRCPRTLENCGQRLVGVGAADMGVTAKRYQGRNEPLWWTRYFSPVCWLLWVLKGPPRNPQKGREGESGTLQSPGPGREHEGLIQGGIAPATWAPTVTSVLPLFNVALLSLQWCLIGFFFFN